jgi:hypothetical protein
LFGGRAECITISQTVAAMSIQMSPKFLQQVKVVMN